MKIFEVKLVLFWQLINYGPSLWVWMTEHPTFLHSYSKAESSWKHSPGSELPLPLKIRWLSSLGTEAQLNKLLQNGIFAFKWNVKHSYTVVEEPGWLAGVQHIACRNQRSDGERQPSRKAELPRDEPEQGQTSPTSAISPCSVTQPLPAQDRGRAQRGLHGKGTIQIQKEEVSPFVAVQIVKGKKTPEKLICTQLT